jgi:UDP-N-acetylmuramate--alanine ligase
MNKMDIHQINSVYFLGIGGIGMSAQARYFNHRGIRVAGYDKTSSTITSQLIEEGIDVHFTEDISLLPDPIDLVILTPAIPATHKELILLTEKGVPILKRSEVLGLITHDLFTIAIAGTHGKTTITSMISHILKAAGIRITAFIGGISKNYSSNLIDDDNASMMVVEADEFDRSFLHLEPDIAVISAMDADHLDVYGSYDNMVSSYQTFAGHIKPGGHLVVNHSLSGFFDSGRVVTASLMDPDADVHASGFTIHHGLQQMDIHIADRSLHNLVIGIPGRFNAENATVAVAVCFLIGIEEKAIRDALLTYSGVRRRFDLRVTAGDRIYLDDYAHHPEEISACIMAARELFPDKKLTVAFQPHLYSRTRDFADGFAQSLAKADEVILLDIYPARENPIPGVNSEMLLDKIQIKEKILCSKDSLPDMILEKKPELLLTLGAGDIELLVEQIEEVMNQLSLKK